MLTRAGDQKELVLSYEFTPDGSPMQLDLLTQTGKKLHYTIDFDGQNSVKFNVKNRDEVTYHKDVSGPDEQLHVLLKAATLSALVTIGQQGGYYFLDDQIQKDGRTVYLNEDKNIVPAFETVRNQIALGIHDRFTNLLKKTRFFEDMEFDALESKIDVHVNFTDNEMNVSASLPESSMERIPKVITAHYLNVRLKELLMVSSEIVDECFESPGSITLSRLHDITEEHGVSVRAFNGVIVIRDHQSVLSSEMDSFVGEDSENVTVSPYQELALGVYYYPPYKLVFAVKPAGAALAGLELERIMGKKLGSDVHKWKIW